MNQLKKFGTWAKKIAKWYQEVDSFIQSIPRLLLYFIYGSSIVFGVIAAIYASIIGIFPVLLMGLLMIILPLIVHLRGWITGIFSLCWREMVKPFFLWILWIRTHGFSVLLTPEFGMQLGAVVFTGFALYQFRKPLIFLIYEGAMFFLSFLGEELYLPGIVSILIIILATTIPGFFVGFLTGSEGKGKNSIGFSSFLVAWIDFAYWAPEIFSSLRRDAWGISIIVLILISNTIISFIDCGVGMLGGYLGEVIGIYVRKEILEKMIWRLKRRKEALAWELEDRLTELKEQLSEGVITQKEYEQKKKKLLEEFKA